MRPTVIVVLLFVFVTGCGEERPVSPLSEVLASPPHEIDNAWVTHADIVINGKDLSSNDVYVVRGQPVRIHGSITIDQSKFEGGRGSAMVMFRMLPAGASDAEWDDANRNWEWSGYSGLTLRDEPRPVRLQGDFGPGDYDMRAYALVEDFANVDSLPVYPLIAVGKVKVIESKQDQSQ